MSPERWQKIQALFEQTLERGVPDRRAFLEQACGDDTALRDEVASLLTADQQAGSFMSEHSVGLDLDSPPEGEAWIGRNIGPYKILRPIGHGGMSTVFLAARDDDEYRGQVAIKVTRRGPGSADLRQRFLRERQILADLNHPNIAQLHDAGTTSEGIPYFVMELVDGVSILEFCDRQRLPIAARLELFLEVCNAVQAAHRSLIVHRDIKPANLLITSDGRPKLLDFGIAKPLDPATLAESLEATRTWQRPMTLAYASPEQIRGKSLSTATDVYSLGVVLYELLTGRHPHRSSTDTLSDLEGAILQRPPQRPSTAIEPVGGPPIDPAEDRPDADEIGRRRNVNPHQLQRQLRGDLDNIVLMALRKDPARRYSSVEQMAEDLRRYQDGLPVVARPSSLGYRSRKFVGRNKLAVGTAALIVLLVLGFGVAMAFQTA
ncbi:MAG: serine/threonine-protein kinase, partial [Acidobacteriota bacterium]